MRGARLLSAYERTLPLQTASFVVPAKAGTHSADPPDFAGVGNALPIR
jgi:hypothetical protein